MKRITYIIFLAGIVVIVSACAQIKPGDNIGSMTVEEHSMSTRYPDIYDYCIYSPEGNKPSTQLAECNIPLTSRIQVHIGWSANDKTSLNSNWDAMTWEMYIDNHQIALDEFGQWSDSGRPDLGVNNFVRGWILDINNVSPGKHTLRYSWTSEIAIDDGLIVHQPGTYEHVVNFTVAEK